MFICSSWRSRQFFPFETENTPFGECVSFGFEAIIRGILDAFKLTKIAQTKGDVQLCFTIDAAELHNSATHVTAGVKVVDYRAYDPLTGKPLSSTVLNDALRVRLFDCQSRNYCYVLKMLFGKDSKQVYKDVFQDVFNYAKILTEVGIAKSILGPVLKPFSIQLPQDLKTFWELLGTGGAAKVAEDFCHLCVCKSSNILHFTEGPNRCARCQKNEKSKCYH